MRWGNRRQVEALAKARRKLAVVPRCGAKCRRTGLPCRTPAMANGRCRMHGGKSPGAPAGADHWNYKHGQRVQSAALAAAKAIERRRVKLMQRELELLRAELERRKR